MKDEKKFFNQKAFEEYGIEINSVSSFIDEINHIKDKLSGSNEEFFFRGQKTDFWNVKPSVFRDDFLPVEHKLMQLPLLKVPHEFTGISNNFEIMTKYQHYGMCTRLLDLTTNPLVALYFACEKYGNVRYIIRDEDEEIEEEAYGIVYYNKEYPVTARDYKVEIISSLSYFDLSKNNTLDFILEQLEKRKVITNKEKNNWLTEEEYKSFVDIIQNNYIVSPSYSNERLSRQSGMFLLAGCFNFNRAEMLSKSTIEKSYKDLRKEFEDTFFYVKGENKKKILAELDTYNINEATLFPELEHQLNYIKTRNKSNVYLVSEFIKYTDEILAIVDKEYNVKIDDDLLKNIDFSERINEYLKKKYPSLSDKIFEEIKKCVSKIDWYNQKSALSALKVGIRKLFLNDGSKREELAEDVNDIVKKVLDVAKQVSYKE